MATGKAPRPKQPANRSTADVESQPVVDNQREVGLPRIVARTWGLISGVSFLSNGGYLLVEEVSDDCVGAGVFMIVMGLVIIFLECACCLCPGNCCDRMESRFPFWARGMIYIVSTIPVLLLCFGVKTLISSIVVIMLGLLYIFLTCLVKSKKYERLQAHARHEFKRRQKETAVSYQAVSTTHNTINSLKKLSHQNMNKNKPKRPGTAGGSRGPRGGGSRGSGKPTRS